MNLDANKIRSILRGEVNGSARFLALAFCAGLAWFGSSWLSGLGRSAGSSLALSQSRYAELGRLATEYNALAPAASSHGGDMDVMTAFTQVSAKVGLGSRANNISPRPDGSCVVEVSGVYAEELADVVKELALRGVGVMAADITTVPAGEERLFRLVLTIGRDA